MFVVEANYQLLLVPWQPTDILSAEVIQTIFDNNLAAPSIELFPEFTEGMKSMSGLCGIPGILCCVDI